MYDILIKNFKFPLKEKRHKKWDAYKRAQSNGSKTTTDRSDSNPIGITLTLEVNRRRLSELIGGNNRRLNCMVPIKKYRLKVKKWKEVEGAEGACGRMTMVIVWNIHVQKCHNVRHWSVQLIGVITEKKQEVEKELTRKGRLEQHTKDTLNPHTNPQWLKPARHCNTKWLLRGDPSGLLLQIHSTNITWHQLLSSHHGILFWAWYNFLKKF